MTVLTVKKFFLSYVEMNVCKQIKFMFSFQNIMELLKLALQPI